MMERNRFSAQQHLNPLGVNDGDLSDVYAKLFGPPSKTYEPDAHDKQSYSHYALPELFRDKTTLVKDSIDGFILDSPEENFYTQVLLPWQLSPGLTVEWNEWFFDGGVAEQVPHEGVSRLLTSQKTKHKKTILRRGIGFKMEGDFFGTEDGKEAYRRNIKGIANTVKETQDYDTIVQLLLANTYEKTWHSRYRTESIPLEKVFEEEIQNYSMLTFDKDRLLIIFEHSKRFMNRDGVRGPFVLVMTPGSQIYLTMVGKDTEYWIGGPGGINRARRGPKSLGVLPDGSRVFETRDFNVDTNTEAFQPATRRMSIAEFYQMYMNAWKYEDLSKGFQSKHRDTVLYDETRDSWQRVHFLDAFINSRLFGEDGNYAKPLVDHVRKFNHESHMELDGEQGKPSPHFLSAPDNDGNHFLVKYFGQMTGSHDHFIQMGQTLMGSIMDGDSQDHLDTWDDMLRLFDEIESQPYDHDYWLELIKANEQNSISQTGEFIGQRTSAGALRDWGEKRTLREWAPNTSGSLNLPDGHKLNGVDYPAGFANFPGLLTLAREAGKENSYWQKLGKRAKKITELVHKIVDRCRRIVPTSAVINPKHQSLWFHKPDAATVFVENVAGVRRHPIWIAALAPIKDEQGQVRGGGFGSEEQESKDEIPWHKRPRIPLVISPGEDLQEIEELARRIKQGEFSVREGNYEYTSPVTGTRVSIPYAQLTYSGLLPKELVLLMLMGTKSSVALMKIFRGIENVPYSGNPEERVRAKKDMINMTLSTLFGYAVAEKNRAQLRALVRGIAQDADTPKTLVSTINTIHLGSGATSTEIKKSRNMIARLIKMVSVEKDEDIPEFKDLENLYPPAIKRVLTGDVGAIDVSEPAGISIKALEPDFEKIRDIILELNLIRSELGVDAIDFTGVLTPVVEITAPPSPLLPRHNELAREYNLLAGKIQNAFEGIDDTFAASLRGEVVKRVDRRKFAVADDGAAAMRSRFFRSPMTMSLDLLESLSRAGQAAFIRPSDPTTAHTTFFYDLQDNDEMSTTLPGELWKRPEFARISDFLNSKQLDHITFVAKEIKTPTPSSAFDDDDDDDDDNFSGRRRPAFKIKTDSKRRRIEAGRLQERVSFPDDGSSDDESDELEDVFGVPRSSVGFRDPQDGWNRKTLRDPGSGVDVRRLSGNLTYTDKYNRIATEAFMANYSQSNDIGDPLLRAMVQIILFTKSTGDQWIKMIKNDVLVPINILLWRPTIAHNMDTFILMKPGLETGANLYRNSHFGTGNDMASKILIGNYTFYSKAVIWEPKNVTLLESVKPAGYCGGNNVDFMAGKRDLITRSNSKYRPSLVATALPLSEPDPMKYMDLTGYTFINPGMRTYSTADYYANIWGITNVDNHMDGKYSFFHKSKRINYTALQGHQYLYNITTGEMNRIIECQGHRKKEGSYPGAASIWNGVDKYHKPYDFASVKLE